MKFFEAYTQVLKDFNEKDYKNSEYQAKTKYVFQNLFSLNSEIEICSNGQVYVTYFDVESDTKYASLLDNEMILALCNMPDSQMHLIREE